jgi:hypothetical protein
VVQRTNLVRWGGLAALLSGIAFIVVALLTLSASNPLASPWLYVCFIVAVLLLVVGLVALHVLQHEEYGRIGRAGFYTAIVSSLAQVLGVAVLLAGSTALVWLVYPVGSFGAFVGFVLYGAATLQAKVLPRWYGIALILSVPVTIGLLPYGFLWFGLVWLVLGYVLWRQRAASVGRPRRVR